MTELLSCPFCGSEARSGNGFSPAESITYAWCSNHDCALHLIGDCGFTPEAWNTRAQPAAVAVPDDLRSRLMEGLDAIVSLSRNLRHGGCDSTDLPDLEEGLRHAIDMASEMLSMLDAPAPAQPGGWIPVGERMPDALKPVMASYTSNYDGKSRTIRARWVAKLTQESEDIDDFDAQYDEETDTYYDHEGWYELIDNWGEYSSVAVTEGEVTHWQPLPAAPKQENKP